MSPVTTTLVVLVLTDIPVFVVTIYWVITEPPFEAGAVQLTVADLSLATATTLVGAPGEEFSQTGPKKPSAHLQK